MILLVPHAVAAYAVVAAPAPEKSQPTSVEAIWVNAGPLDSTGLARDLKVRLPSVAMLGNAGELANAASSDGLVVFVGVTVARGKGFALELVASDGRAFDRVVDVDSTWSSAEQRRVVARNVANLIEGIEAGTETPDREDVTLPSPCVCPPAEPPPRECPKVDPKPAPPKEPQPTRAEELPRWELGPWFSLGATLGLGAPQDTDRFAGAGGSVGAQLRAPVGGLFLAQVRVLGRGAGDLDASILRMRTSLGGGYAWRSSAKQAELVLAGAVSIEPWFVRQGGARASVQERAPALGGWLRLSSGVLLGPKRSAVRLGGWLEAAVSGIPSAGGRVAKISIESNDVLEPSFRVGGIELSAGIETVIMFGLGPKRRSNSTR